LAGTLSVTPASAIVKSAVQIKFAMAFKASLPGISGPVKLFTASAVGAFLQYVTDLQAAAGSSYVASLALQGSQLGSLSSSPGVLRFTAVVGAGNTATGAVAQLELLPGEFNNHISHGLM
jgi:hypothetical protein